MIVSTGLLALAMMASSATSTPTSAAPNTPPVNSLDKVKCRRILETGSLVKGKRVCLTNREWALASEKGSDRAREMQTLINTEQGR
jgi:hypothetical protein